MSDNKTVPTTATVDSFLATVSQQRADEARELIRMMERISGHPAVMWGPSIIGFGSYHYRYESGREGDMPLIAFSPRKAQLVLYVLDDATNYTEILGRLGKHKTSKACLYITKLADVDAAVLEELVTAAHKNAAKL